MTMHGTYQCCWKCGAYHPGDALDPCMCAYTHLIPMPVANITEQRIREIVRDEIERAKGAAK